MDKPATATKADEKSDVKPANGEGASMGVMLPDYLKEDLDIVVVCA